MYMYTYYYYLFHRPWPITSLKVNLSLSSWQSFKVILSSMSITAMISNDKDILPIFAEGKSESLWGVTDSRCNGVGGPTVTDMGRTGI